MSLELWDIVLSSVLNTSYVLQEGPRISVNCSIKQLDNDLDNVSDKVITVGIVKTTHRGNLLGIVITMPTVITLSITL